MHGDFGFKPNEFGDTYQSFDPVDKHHPFVSKEKGFEVNSSTQPKLKEANINQVFLRCYPKENQEWNDDYGGKLPVKDWSHMPVKRDDVSKFMYKFLGFKKDGNLEFEKPDGEKISIDRSFNDDHWMLIG